MTYFSRRMVNHLMDQQHIYQARIVATIVTIVCCVFVYLLIQAMMPYMIKIMDLFYHS
ncbi:hypothetical protein [Staphylococcus simiae]|nr:hypothetical protein [Staphylococcus simiae]